MFIIYSYTSVLMKTYKMKINGNAYEVAVKNIEGTNVEVEVNGKAYNVELEQPAKPAAFRRK